MSDADPVIDRLKLVHRAAGAWTYRDTIKGHLYQLVCYKDQPTGPMGGKRDDWEVSVWASSWPCIALACLDDDRGSWCLSTGLSPEGVFDRKRDAFAALLDFVSTEKEQIDE